MSAYHAEQDADENDYTEDSPVDTSAWYTSQPEDAFQENNPNVLDESVFHYGSFALPDPADTGSDEPDVNYASPSIVEMPAHVCRLCNVEFYSNNKLHRHLPACRKEHKKSTVDSVKGFHGQPTGVPIIESTAKHEGDAGYQFRKWHYARMEASHTLADELVKLCADSECTMSLVDRKHLAATKPNAIIQRASNPIRVRGIDHRLHDSSEYTELDFYIPGKLPDGTSAIAHFRREIHIVDDLRANALLGVDIIGPEEAVLDFGLRVLTLRGCDGLQAPMDIVPKGHRITRAVRSATLVTIPPHTCMTVPIKIRGSSLPEDRDYSFEPKQDFQALGPEGGFFNHVTNAHIAAVQVRNASNKAYTLPKNAKVGMLRDYEEEGCYNASPDDRHLAAVSSRS